MVEVGFKIQKKNQNKVNVASLQHNNMKMLEIARPNVEAVFF